MKCKGTDPRTELQRLIEGTDPKTGTSMEKSGPPGGTALSNEIPSGKGMVPHTALYHTPDIIILNVIFVTPHPSRGGVGPGGLARANAKAKS
jgi:hypothetical protein